MTYYFSGSYPSGENMSYYYFGIEEDPMNTYIQVEWEDIWLEHLQLQKEEGRKYYSLNEIWKDLELGVEKTKQVRKEMLKERNNG